MAKEMIDIFDCNYNHIGIEDKEEAHKKGAWHQSFHCWIVRPNGKIILQLRSKDKSTYPNTLDISGAGHLSAGEEPLDGIRELEEELGLVVNPESLNYLGYYKQAVDIPTKNGIFYNREFSHTFLLLDDTPLDEYIMQDDEVDGVFEIDIKEGLKFFSDEIDNISISGIYRENKENVTKSVGFESFTPRAKCMWVKVFIMAERLLQGEKYLAV
jgi:isopentenyldiphosphate isomerase